MGKTLAEKIWAEHLVRSVDNEPDLLYIDLHLIHEVTSPQAFDGLRLSQRKVRRPDLTIATEDHNVPTIDIDRPIADPISKLQVDTLRNNCKEFGIRLHSLGDKNQGVVHVVGPQLGITQPGMTIVCGDSHTSTHGAFGAIAFGIGTSEVEHVLATQTLPSTRPKMMAINVEGNLKPGVTSKDIILTIIAKIGTGGGQGYIVEYRGSAIRSLSMEARMTVCNMSIEAGARAGLIAPDETTFAYIKGKPHAPQNWDEALAYWKTLYSDPDARFDAEVNINAEDIEPFVTWGTNPGQGLPLSAAIPDPDSLSDEQERVAARRALEYMGLKAGTPLKTIKIDTVFLGSCTNGRIEDLRTAAEIIKGKKVAAGVRMLVVPGSAKVRLDAEAEGLDKVFTDAGAEWRNAGCSMCLGMNPDQLKVGERSASTSNRNFEGRQGKGGRTHLVSPLVAAATALRGTLSSPADLQKAGDVMDKFIKHTGTAVPLRRSNVDTDQIIPAVYLKRVTRSGFEDGLFAAWRNDPEFVLNQRQYKNATILVAGADFGTGSSREHAVWALQNYGFKVVISSRFADIFRSNSLKGGLLTVILTQEEVDALWLAIEADPNLEITVDLDKKNVTYLGKTLAFSLDDYTRWRLMEGLDDIGLTLKQIDLIDTFEGKRPRFKPATLPIR